MSNINKREFAELALDGSNYLTWALDVEIYLASCDLGQAIVQNANCSPADKAKTLIFLRHHLNQDLKNEYLTEKEPQVLWQSLKDRFDQQTALILPQAQFDWMNLRFQDFKSVTEYNSVLHRIVSQLKLCKQDVTDTELIEKTLSTFHANNLILQQQYRAKNYTKHSELISALLVAEKHNQILMKYHNARPVGSQVVFEAHAATHKGGKRRGRERGQGDANGFRRGRGRGYNNVDRSQGRGRGQNSKKFVQGSNSVQQTTRQKQVCFRCGCEGHWSRTCRTPRHLVDAYLRYQKEKSTNDIKGESHHAVVPEAHKVINAADEYDHLKFDFEDYGDQE